MFAKFVSPFLMRGYFFQNPIKKYSIDCYVLSLFHPPYINRRNEKPVWFYFFGKIFKNFYFTISLFLKRALKPAILASSATLYSPKYKPKLSVLK